MRKVLVITYFFFQNEIIASVRLRGLIKYLWEYGWEATVLTIKCDVVNDRYETGDQKIVETDYEDLLRNWKKTLGLSPEKGVKEQLGLPVKRKKGIIDTVIQLWSEIFLYPDAEIGWYRPAIDAGTRILDNESFDIILSSSSPVTSHLIASYLSKRYNIPWIADFRDPWTQSHLYPYSSIRRFWERRLELRVISSTRALTTVSQPLVDKLSAIHKGKKVYSIPNGFDPDIVNPGSQVSEKFTICYTGFVHKKHQNPEILFDAIKQLIEESKIAQEDVVINFYGRDDGWLQFDIENYGLDNIVRIHGIVPRDVALQNQRESQILLLLTWNDPREKGVYTGKVFEYLAAKRPILALGLNGGVITDLIQQTNAGSFASSVAETKKVILDWYQEYKSSGVVSWHGIQSEVNKYNHREMTKKFAEVFDECLEQTFK